MRSSAGKNSSTHSSSSVTSRGVPNVVSVVKNDSSTGPLISWNGTSSGGSSPSPIALGVGRWPRFGYARTSASRSLECRVAGELHGAAELAQQVGRPVVEVDRPPGEAVGVQADPEDVHRRPGQLGREAVGQGASGGVGQHHVPQPVDHHARVGVVGVEHPLQRGPYPLHRGIVEGSLRVARRVARGQQHRVALPERHVQVLGHGQHELRAGPRPARLDEAEVPGRHTDVEREIELAAPSALPPLAHQGSDSGAGHAPNARDAAGASP